MKRFLNKKILMLIIIEIFKKIRLLSNFLMFAGKMYKLKCEAMNL